MQITNDMLFSLQASFKGEGKVAEKNHEGSERLTFGNLWFGDYLHLCSDGEFGTETKDRHWGVITDKRKKKKAGRRITPITSKTKNCKNCIILPEGVIESCTSCKSYILTSMQNRLLVRVMTLEENFQYSGKLPEVYLGELKRKIHDK